jgi:hypothetical protein
MSQANRSHREGSSSTSRTPSSGVRALCPSCDRDCGKSTHVDANGAFAIEEVDANLKFSLLAIADGYEPVCTRRDRRPLHRSVFYADTDD